MPQYQDSINQLVSDSLQPVLNRVDAMLKEQAAKGIPVTHAHTQEIAREATDYALSEASDGLVRIAEHYERSDDKVEDDFIDAMIDKARDHIYKAVTVI